MIIATLPRVTAKTATEVCGDLELEPPARGLLRNGATPAQFLQALVEKTMLDDALRFLARAMPKREAIWWGCACAKLVLDNTASPEEQAALKAAEKWVQDPSEDNRRAAMKASEASTGGPGKFLACAVFFSGGSLAPANCPVVVPPENMTGKFVAGAIALSTVMREPQKKVEKVTRFVTQGVDIANGKGLWK
jgi:uncharacterized protein DUF6931